MLTMNGRTCVFAGATGNIGRGAVKKMAAGGMNVVMVTHNPDSAGEIISDCGSLPGKVLALSNEGGDHTVFGRVERELGSVDVLVISTGGLAAVQPLEEIAPEFLTQKFDHQVRGAFQMAQAAVPYLEKSSHARIIFCSSAGAENGFAGENLADSIARGGVLTMTKCMARLLMEKNITVNCVARSGMIDDHEPHPGALRARDLLPAIPLGRLGSAEEFGGLVAYLASEESGFITGHIFDLSGGINI